MRRCTTAGGGLASYREVCRARVPYAPGEHFPVREVMHMVPYAELIQIGILIVSVCNLVYQICKRK